MKAANALRLVNELLVRIPVGARISVFADGSAGASKHLVHRNGNDNDGLIIVDPTGVPETFAFHFDGQTF